MRAAGSRAPIRAPVDVTSAVLQFEKRTYQHTYTKHTTYIQIQNYIHTYKKNIGKKETPLVLGSRKAAPQTRTVTAAGGGARGRVREGWACSTAGRSSLSSSTASSGAWRGAGLVSPTGSMNGTSDSPAPRVRCARGPGVDMDMAEQRFGRGEERKMPGRWEGEGREARERAPSRRNVCACVWVCVWVCVHVSAYVSMCARVCVCLCVQT